MSEDLKFATKEQALQHLSDLTGKKIKVAWEDDFAFNGDTKTTKEKAFDLRKMEDEWDKGKFPSKDEAFEEAEQEKQFWNKDNSIEIDPNMSLSEIEDLVKHKFKTIGYDNERYEYPTFSVDGMKIKNTSGKVEDTLDEIEALLQKKSKVATDKNTVANPEKYPNFEIRDMLIENNIPPRAIYALAHSGINTIEALKTVSPASLNKMLNMNQMAAKEVIGLVISLIWMSK